MLDELKRKADLFKQFDKKYYFIFAKGLFSKALLDIASGNENVKLISLKDIYKN